MQDHSVGAKSFKVIVHILYCKLWGRKADSKGIYCRSAREVRRFVVFSITVLKSTGRTT